MREGCQLALTEGRGSGTQSTWKWPTSCSTLHSTCAATPRSPWSSPEPPDWRAMSPKPKPPSGSGWTRVTCDWDCYPGARPKTPCAHRSWTKPTACPSRRRPGAGGCCRFGHPAGRTANRPFSGRRPGGHPAHDGVHLGPSAGKRANRGCRGGGRPQRWPANCTTASGIDPPSANPSKCPLRLSFLALEWPAISRLMGRDAAGIAQLVEHDLAKVGVASSSLVSRSTSLAPPTVGG